MNGIVKVDLCELDSLRDRSKLLDEVLEVIIKMIELANENVDVLMDKKK